MADFTKISRLACNFSTINMPYGFPAVTTESKRGFQPYSWCHDPAIREAHQITGAGLQRLRWRRYEIESYLLCPDLLARFVETVIGAEAVCPHIEDMLAYWQDTFPPAAARDPLGDQEFLNATKARQHPRLLPPLLEAAGVSEFPYTRHHEIGQAMLPE